MKRNYPTRAEHNAKMRMAKRHIEREMQLNEQWIKAQLKHRTWWEIFKDFIGV